MYTSTFTLSQYSTVTSAALGTYQCVLFFSVYIPVCYCLGSYLPFFQRVSFLFSMYAVVLSFCAALPPYHPLFLCLLPFPSPFNSSFSNSLSRFSVQLSLSFCSLTHISLSVFMLTHSPQSIQLGACRVFAPLTHFDHVAPSFSLLVTNSVLRAQLEQVSVDRQHTGSRSHVSSQFTMIIVVSTSTGYHMGNPTVHSFWTFQGLAECQRRRRRRREEEKHERQSMHHLHDNINHATFSLS